MNPDPSAPLTPATREKLLVVSRKMQIESERQLHQMVSLRRRGGEKLPPEIREISNAHEFVALLNFDMNVLFEDFLSAKSDLRANLYVRLLLLTVYESARSLRSVIDHRFRAAVLTHVNDPTIEADLKDAHSRITKLFTQCEGQFGDVRNGLLGHRDRDPETRIQLIEKTDAEAVTNLVVEALAAISLVSKSLLAVWKQVAERMIKTY